MGRKKEIAALQISSNLAGKKVIEVLKEELEIPNRQIKRVVYTKGLFLNRRPVHTERKVKIGDLLSVKLPVAEQLKVEPAPMRLSLIYEDEYLLAVNKPSGINVHNTRCDEEPALVNGIAHYLMEKKQVITPRPLHRIDRATSGLVLFAKSAAVQNKLTKQWGTNRVTKKYWALVEGAAENEGTIGIPLKGKKARTRFFPIQVHQGLTSSVFTELILEITTGRTHQIRKHLQLIGHPVLGDVLYNQNSRLNVGRLALHAFTLKLYHPKTGDPLSLKAPIPRADFSYLLKNHEPSVQSQ